MREKNYDRLESRLSNPLRQSEILCDQGGKSAVLYTNHYMLRYVVENTGSQLQCYQIGIIGSSTNYQSLPAATALLAVSIR